MFSLRILLLILALTAVSTPLAAGDWDDYKKFGDRSPRCAPLIDAGYSAKGSDNLDASFNFFEKSVKAGCLDGLVFYHLGLAFETKGDLNKAKDYLTQTLTLLPKQYPGHVGIKLLHEHIGRVLFALGDLPGAKAEFLRAVEEAGENFTLMFFLGSIARKENNDQEIIQYYEKALNLPTPQEVNPLDTKVTILVEIGKSYYNLKDTATSLKYWDKVLEIVPNHPIARQFKKSIEQKAMEEKLKEQQKRILEQLTK